jgi:hypothetical protein
LSSQSFVGCLLGVKYIGYATLCFRGSLIACSLLAGQLVTCVNRRTIVLVAQLVMIVAICTWFIPLPSRTSRPDSSPDVQMTILVVVMTWCAANGAVYGLLRTAVFGLFPLLFRRNLPFALAHANIWESFGAALTFFINDRFCFGVKAYAFIVLTAVAAATYVALECVISDSNAASDDDDEFVVVVGETRKTATTGEVAVTDEDGTNDPFISVSTSLIDVLDNRDDDGDVRSKSAKFA